MELTAKDAEYAESDSLSWNGSALFRKMRVGQILTLALLPLVFGSIFAADYFVATNGNDASGNGSVDRPWATIAYAVTAVSDGSTILVRPGLYEGRIRLDRRFTQGIVVRSEVPYRAQLQHTATVVTCYTGQGITLEGFDISHSGAGAGALVLQVQDLIDGTDATSRITFQNNILHDSYNNDILKINNGARDIVVRGNIFYNQAGSDEHIDVNSVRDVTIEDNVFFSDFAGSGRVNGNDTSSFVVIKDSNGADDDVIGSERITVRRNVFLNWEGSTGQSFVRVGEDGTANFEAIGVLIENNLMLGNSANVMRTAFTVQGSKDVTFSHNTVVGNLPALAFAMRLIQIGANRPNENIRFYNNIYSDPTGTMGAGNTGANDFSDTPPGETSSFVLERNLYWNGSSSIPADANELVNYTDDSTRLVADPSLPALTGVELPRWVPDLGFFLPNAATIREAFENLVARYGMPDVTSPARNAALLTQSPPDDILGRARSTADIGAVEIPDSSIRFRASTVSGDTLRMEVEGSSGVVCYLETSSNLGNWGTVSTNVFGTNSIATFVQPISAATRFYRARTP